MNCNHHIWTTQDGDEVYLHDMGNQHLRNALAFLERQARWVYSDPTLGGDAAQDAYEQVVREYEHTLSAMREELERRRVPR